MPGRRSSSFMRQPYDPGPTETVASQFPFLQTSEANFLWFRRVTELLDRLAGSHLFANRWQNPRVADATMFPKERQTVPDMTTSAFLKCRDRVPIRSSSVLEVSMFDIAGKFGDSF